MTSRTGKPDTQADIELRELLDDDNSTGFVMVAGAGSGKTTSIVKALDHLRKTRGAHLRQRAQKVACITYTEVAVDEIWGDVGNDPLFHVSTIHSFLWAALRPFQADIALWVDRRIDRGSPTRKPRSRLSPSVHTRRLVFRPPLTSSGIATKSKRSNL